MPATTDPAALSPEQRQAVERWFVRRGVPQFIAGYGSEQSMDKRAGPLITLWIVAWSALFWLGRPETPFPWNVAAILGSLAFAIFIDGFIDTLRGRSVVRFPPKFDLIDIATFAALPVVPTLLVERDPMDVLGSFLNVLLGIGIIYVVIGFGLLDIAGWALALLRDQLVHIATLVSRTLPLLLILVVFLMFAAELWEAAHGLHVGELAAVLALLLFVGSVLIVSTFGPEIRKLEGAPDWEAARAEVRDTPVADLAAQPIREDVRIPRLSWLQRRNVEFLVLINQLVQSTFVSALVFAFLVTFGLIVVPVSVQVGWIGEPVSSLAQLELLGETRVLSAELLGVSALLSGIVGLYFTGLALTDPTYRNEHFTAVVGELRMLLAARAIYLAALLSARPSAAGARTSDPAAVPETELATDAAITRTARGPRRER